MLLVFSFECFSMFPWEISPCYLLSPDVMNCASLFFSVLVGIINVTILKLEGGKETQLFQTDQRNLFGKYADKRCVTAQLVHICMHLPCMSYLQTSRTVLQKCKLFCEHAGNSRCWGHMAYQFSACVAAWGFRIVHVCEHVNKNQTFSLHMC